MAGATGADGPGDTPASRSGEAFAAAGGLGIVPVVKSLPQASQNGAAASL
jgi:hypothetical protein